MCWGNRFLFAMRACLLSLCLGWRCASQGVVLWLAAEGVEERDVGRDNPQALNYETPFYVKILLVYKRHPMRVSFVSAHMKLTLYDNLKRSVAHLVYVFKIDVAPAITGRPRKIKKQEALVLALYQHTSTRATKRSVYEDLKHMLKCSYKTLVVAMNEAGMLTLRLLFLLMRVGRKNASRVKYTDATDLPVCLKKNADIHKVMQDFAGFGYSAKGWYFGLKLTMTRDEEGRILGLYVTPPWMNDRDIFRTINKDIEGILVADAGYVSKQLEEDMHIEGKRWTLIRPYRTMKRLATFGQLEMYRGRFQIELDFRSLKLFFGLVTSLPRSVNGYLSNYLHALLAFAVR